MHFRTRRSSAVIALIVITLLTILMQLPSIHTQTPAVQAAIARVPVTLDGRVQSGEYGDTRGYPYNCKILTVQNGEITFLPCASQSRMYVKYDLNWTYFGFDFVNDTDPGAYCWMNFDLENRPSAKDSTYRLGVEISDRSSNPTPGTPLFAGNSPDPYYGTSFSDVFKISTDYSYAAYWGSSALSSIPHIQFELQIRTRLITTSYSPVLIDSDVAACGPFMESIDNVYLQFSVPVLTINLPSNVVVTVDGIRQLQYGRVQVGLAIGTHTLSVPALVRIGPNTRLSFVRWSDGNTQISRTITMSLADSSIQPIYTTQYRLIIGNFSESKWYDANSSVSLPTPQPPPIDNLMATLGGKWVFTGWYDNGNLTTTAINGPLTLSRPYNLTPEWQLDNSKPYEIIDTAVVIVGAVTIIVGVVVFRRRKVM